MSMDAVLSSMPLGPASFDRPMVGWGRRNVPGHVLEWVEGDGKLLGSRMDQAALQRGNCKSLM